MTAHFGNRGGGCIELGADQIAPFLGIKLRGNRRRADQVAEHDRKVTALAGGLGRYD